MYEAESFAPLGLYLPSLVADLRLAPLRGFPNFPASLIATSLLP